MPLLKCESLFKRYGGFTALEDVTFQIDPGEILGVAGPNGAGKTTLFDVISGHQRLDGGQVFLGGMDVSDAPAFRRARNGLARTFQSPLVPTDISITEVFEAAKAAWHSGEDFLDIGYLRDLLDFRADGNRLCGSLDTLERRQLLLLTLLIRKPAVLLMDEPCSGLLPDEIMVVESLILRIRDEFGTGIIAVEHRLELLHAIAVEMLVLDYGRIIAKGRPSDVLSHPDVRRAYFSSNGGAESDIGAEAK